MFEMKKGTPEGVAPGARLFACTQDDGRCANRRSSSPMLQTSLHNIGLHRPVVGKSQRYMCGWRSHRRGVLANRYPDVTAGAEKLGAVPDIGCRKNC